MFIYGIAKQREVRWRKLIVDEKQLYISAAAWLSKALPVAVLYLDELHANLFLSYGKEANIG